MTAAGVLLTLTVFVHAWRQSRRQARALRAWEAKRAEEERKRVAAALAVERLLAEVTATFEREYSR